MRQSWRVAVGVWAAVTLACATVPTTEPLPSHSRLLRLVQYTTPTVGTASLESSGPQAPAGWPDWSARDEELLAPFLKCSTPAQFLRLQQAVDMARLLEQLEDWSAVKLGALGPMDARASQVLTRKRAAFILHATEAYGEELAQVFTLFRCASANGYGCPSCAPTGTCAHAKPCWTTHWPSSTARPSGTAHVEPPERASPSRSHGGTGLRAIMLEGSPLLALWPQGLILGVWGLIPVLIAVRYFKWM